jgi:hypothetical protein
MIRLRLSADALAVVRFAVSPVMETVVAVQHRWFMPRSARRETPWARAARDPAVWRHLPLLSQLLRDVGVPVPEIPVAGLPSPRPGPGQGASSAASVLAEGLRTFLRGASLTERPSPHARAVWDAAVSQDPTWAERIASELEWFYRLCLAPHWSAIEEQAQAQGSPRTPRDGSSQSRRQGRDRENQ